MKKKVWIDILTPKQVLFFKSLIKTLKSEGCDVHITSRRYRELNQILKLRDLRTRPYGEHGGESLPQKLRSSLMRSFSLVTDIIEERFDFTISFSSVEAARVSYGLSIPHYCISDSPHAEAVSKLTIPLSQLLFTPKIIPKRAWMKFGIESQNIIQYDSLDPVAWLKGFRPDRNVLNELKLDPNKPLITVRPEEAKAAYLLFRGGRKSPVHSFLTRVIEWREDFQIVVLPRYLDQKEDFKSQFAGDERIKVSDTSVDGPSLLSFSTLFIGAGGTMTAEAALQGVSTISCYPSNPTYIERYLLKQRLIKRITDPEKISKTALKAIRKPVDKDERARRLLMKLENPVDVICREILARHKHG